MKNKILIFIFSNIFFSNILLGKDNTNFYKNKVIINSSSKYITTNTDDKKEYDEIFSDIKEYPEYKKSSYAVKRTINEFLSLSNNQIETLFWVYQEANKYDLSLTLTAIAWQESLGGAVPVNIFDKPFGSCGIFHANLKSVIERHPELKLGKRPSKFQLNKLCSQLIFNKKLALNEAVLEIFYWKKIFRHKPHKWSKIWAAYNAGWAWKTAGKTYAKKISLKVRALKIIADYAEWDNLISDKDNSYMLKIK